MVSVTQMLGAFQRTSSATERLRSARASSSASEHAHHSVPRRAGPRSHCAGLARLGGAGGAASFAAT
jgi:hypothetical protein